MKNAARARKHPSASVGGSAGRIDCSEPPATVLHVSPSHLPSTAATLEQRTGAGSVTELLCVPFEPASCAGYTKDGSMGKSLGFIYIYSWVPHYVPLSPRDFKVRSLYILAMF